MIKLHKLNAGDKVLVKVGKNAIKAEVLEVRPDRCLVRNLANGHEFKVTKVEGYLEEPVQPGEDVLVERNGQIVDAQVVGEEGAAALVHGDAANEDFAADVSEEPLPPEEDQAIREEAARQVAEASASCRASGNVIGPGHACGRKKSLLEASYDILLQERRPMNTRELVKAAVERGLWTPTSCKTPEQSLYGAIFLEMKNKENPRFKRSEKRGAFELA